MKSGRDWLKSIVPVIGGLIAGAVASIFVANGPNKAIEPEAKAQVHDTQLIPAKAGAIPFSVSAKGVSQDKRIAELEQRLAELETPKEGEPSSHEGPDDSASLVSWVRS